MKAKITFQRRAKNGHYLRFFFDMQDAAETCYWVWTVDKEITWVSRRVGDGNDRTITADKLPAEVLHHLSKQGIKCPSPTS